MVLLISNIAAWNAACKKYKIVTSLPGQFPVILSFTKPTVGYDTNDIDYEPNAQNVGVMYPMHACKLLSACSQQHLGAAVDGITLVKAAAALKPWHQGLGGIGMQNVQKAPAGVSGVPAYVLEKENGMTSTITSNKEYMVGDVVLVDGVEWTVKEVTKVLSDGVTQVKEDSDLNIMPDKPSIPGMEEIPMDPTLLDQAQPKVANIEDQGHVLDIEREV